MAATRATFNYLAKTDVWRVELSTARKTIVYGFNELTGDEYEEIKNRSLWQQKLNEGWIQNLQVENDKNQTQETPVNEPEDDGGGTTIDVGVDIGVGL